MKKATKLELAILSVVLLFILTIGGGATFILDRLFHLDEYKSEILTIVQQGLKRPVTYGSGRFSLRFGPSFTFTNVAIRDKDGKSPFIAADRMTVKVALLPLLSGELVFRELLVERPQIRFIRNREGQLNIQDLVSGEGGSPLQVESLKIRKGVVTFRDDFIGEGLATSLEDLDLRVGRLAVGEKTSLKLSSFINCGGKRAILSVHGDIRLPSKGEPWTATYFKGRVIAKNLDTSHFWPYYSHNVPFERPRGEIDLTTYFKGALSDFSSKGNIRANNLHFSWPSIFHASLVPRNLSLNYEMALNSDTITVKQMELSVDGLRAKGGCSIKEMESGDPRIVARVNISPFRLEEFRQYVPFGVIPTETSTFIEKKITDGMFFVEEGTLDGHVSQIAHMEIGRNADVLHVKGSVEKAVVSYTPGIPTFNDVKGKLELRGKDFILSDMSGNFGTSPFRGNGMIADFPLKTPTTYPFNMTFTPRAPEVAWITGMGSHAPVFAGNSVLHLTGNGPSTDYRLSADWDLTGAAYSFADVIGKPANMANTLTAKVAFTPGKATLTALDYKFPPLALTANGRYQFGKMPRMEIALRTNEFQLQQAGSFIPLFRKYKCRGVVSASIHGAGEARDADSLKWGGKISLADVSLKPEGMKPLSGVTGGITFKGTTLESSLMAVRLGSSLIYCRGTVNGFSNPAFSVSFSSPEIDPGDFGFKSPSQQLKLRQVEGNLVWKDQALQIKSFTARINETSIDLRGGIEGTAAPRLDIVVSSPHLVLDDILMLAGIEKESARKGAPPLRPVLKADIRADSADLRRLPVKKLSTRLFYENNNLYLQDMQFNFFGGKFSGSGRADFTAGSPPQYQLKYVIDGVSVPPLLSFFGLKNDVMTGNLFMDGEVGATGSSPADLKKTLSGSTNVTVEDGTLRKFPVLSKVFSILNVSQLLKFQLPDMVSGGMPFNSISGKLNFKDGTVSTENLFVDSDAMNISIIGSANLLREDLDLKVGVQPLQTIDKVVSHIPIVGWILTGKDKNLITAYFEAKGPWRDPNVKAIPVKSMARGVFNIFKRVFQLPAKLITDTGEVVVGK